MSRNDLKEIIARVIDLLEGKAPTAACIFGDDPEPCDVTTKYAIGEEG